MEVARLLLEAGETSLSLAPYLVLAFRVPSVPSNLCTMMELKKVYPKEREIVRFKFGFAACNLLGKADWTGSICSLKV